MEWDGWGWMDERQEKKEDDVVCVCVVRVCRSKPTSLSSVVGRLLVPVGWTVDCRWSQANPLEPISGL